MTCSKRRLIDGSIRQRKGGQGKKEERPTNKKKEEERSKVKNTSTAPNENKKRENDVCYKKY